jgi:hypothetical protein
VKSSASGETASTIEFELSADEVGPSIGSVQANQPSLVQTSASPLNAGRPLYRARALRLRSRGIALAVSVALAALLLGIARQQLSKSAGQPQSPATTPVHATAAPQILSTSFSKPVPVRLANPFDATEIFEFPPGTSLQHARETVAEFLLDRARDRHVRHEQRSRNRRELRNS